MPSCGGCGGVATSGGFGPGVGPGGAAGAPGAPGAAGSEGPTGADAELEILEPASICLELVLPVRRLVARARARELPKLVDSPLAWWESLSACIQLAVVALLVVLALRALRGRRRR